MVPYLRKKHHCNMFFGGDISAAMEEAQRQCRPLLVFVVPSGPSAPFGASDAFEWCTLGRFHLSGIVHLVVEGTPEFGQLNAVTAQKQVPRIHVIPHQATTQLPATCVFGAGMTFPHVAQMVSMAARPADAVVEGWEADLLVEAARVTSEGNRTKRSQGRSMPDIQREEEATKELRVSLRLAAAPVMLSSSSSSASSSPVSRNPSVLVTREQLHSEAVKLAGGKKFHVTCGSASASTPEEVAAMTLFQNAIVYVHIDEVATPAPPKSKAPPAASSSSAPTVDEPSLIGKRVREPEPSAASDQPTVALRITDGSGQQFNWVVPATTTVEELFAKAREEILGGAPNVFNLVIAYPARRLGASDFPLTLGVGGLGIKSREAMRLVLATPPPPHAQQHADPNADAPQQGTFGKMASMVGGWLGGRAVAQPPPQRAAAAPPSRMTLGELNRRQAEESEKEGGDQTKYFNGVSTEFEGPPKKKDSDAE